MFSEWLRMENRAAAPNRGGQAGGGRGGAPAGGIDRQVVTDILSESCRQTQEMSDTLARQVMQVQSLRTSDRYYLKSMQKKRNNAICTVAYLVVQVFKMQTEIEWPAKKNSKCKLEMEIEWPATKIFSKCKWKFNGLQKNIFKMQMGGHGIEKSHKQRLLVMFKLLWDFKCHCAKRCTPQGVRG